MNDSAEMNHIVRLINRLCDQRVSDSSDIQSNVILMQFKKWVESRINSGHMLFVSSFTTEGNLLSQWRGYSPITEGVSVGFTSDYIMKCATEQSFLIGKCIYDNKEQEKIADELLDSILKLSTSNGENTDKSKRHPSQSYHDTFEKIEYDLLRIAALFKHGAFREEQEWRVISDVIVNYTKNPIFYRDGISMLVPYLDFSLTLTGKNTIRIPHMYLGPTPNINISMDSLSSYISASRVERGVQISYSGIPFRQW